MTDPKAIAERQEVAFERRTYEHDNVEHCEAEAVGRAIVGVSDTNGQVLVAVHSQEEYAILPNDTVEPGDDWAAVGREWIESMASVEVTLDDIRLVREVEHLVEGEPRSRTHHVIFGGTLANPDATLSKLCDDNPWELRWIDAVPDWLPEDPQGVHGDIELFVGKDA
ncbi:MAG TPA: hypothetical protein VFJ06_12975 [Halococcus sp.]|nr:hypothetical protein [Halococcus sp.]